MGYDYLFANMYGFTNKEALQFKDVMIKLEIREKEQKGITSSSPK